MKENKFSISKRLMSFVYAFNGLKTLFNEEHNARIHLFAAIVVILAGLLFEINMYEWMAIIFAIGLVLTTEIINTAIENIADFLTIEKNEKIKKIKDLSAAAVLMSTLMAVVIGLLVFIPKIWSIYY